MRTEMNLKDQRLLEALDHLDPEFIDEALDVMRIPPANPSPERDRRTTLLSVKLVIALAASLLIIGACIPALSLIIRHYLISPGGTLGSDTEETTLCESETEATTTTETTTETAPVTSGDFEYRVREDGTLAVFYKGEAEEVTVPSEIDGKTVTAIGEGAFWLSRVKKVTLPDTITLIDRDAFSQSGVEEIDLPASLREIGSCAFQECHSLVNIELNEGLRSIGSYAFMNISAERIEIPASVESIGGGAFASCWQLGELILDPENKIYTASGNCIIEKSTKTLIVGFGECVIPSDGSVKSIGEGALGGTPITSLVIPDSVTSIGAQAFIYCSQLKRVSIPATLQSLGEGAFYECKALESISLPYGIKSIGDSTFRGCINLKTASIPYGVESIGEYAFSNCASLTEIYVPESTRTIGRNAFEFCASLWEITIPNSVKVIPDNTFYGCLKLEHAQIGFGTTSIGTYAFGKCPILKKFVFKDLASAWYEVEKGNNWHYASGFTSVQCNDGVVPLTSEQLDNGTPGLLYMINPDGKSASLVSVGDCRETEITVASSYNGYPVTSIGDSVFIDQDKLKSVTIPDTVTEIGYAAFSLCTSLTSIRIPESMTTIGGYAFSMCTSLSEIGLPAGITYIGRDAFTSCPIKEINLGDALESIEAEVFMNCTKLERIALPRSVRSIDLRAFKSCTALESFSFEGSVAEWKAIDRDKSWKDYCSFRYVHCSDGNIEADIMTADVAKQLAADYLGIIIGSKDPETGYRRVFWVKKEPTAASPKYLIAVSYEGAGGYYPIVTEISVDIYTGECATVPHDLADIPENIRAVIKNERTFINGNMGETYFKDSESPSLYRPAQYGNINYAVLDLDGDGNSEMIINGMDGYVILHDTGKEIRAYNCGARSMYGLKTDGTYDWTDLTVSGEYGIQRITGFTESSYLREDLCHIHEGDDGTRTYYVGGNKVTAAEYDAFVATLSSEEVDWRDLDYYPTEMNLPM